MYYKYINYCKSCILFSLTSADYYGVIFSAFRCRFYCVHVKVDAGCCPGWAAAVHMAATGKEALGQALPPHLVCLRLVGVAELQQNYKRFD